MIARFGGQVLWESGRSRSETCIGELRWKGEREEKVCSSELVSPWVDGHGKGMPALRVVNKQYLTENSELAYTGKRSPPVLSRGRCGSASERCVDLRTWWVTTSSLQSRTKSPSRRVSRQAGGS